MKKFLLLTCTVLLAAFPAFGAILEEVGFADNTIAVYWSTDPTYGVTVTSPPSIPIPTSGGVCRVDTSVIDAVYADMIHGPSLITVRTEDINDGFRREPFALGSCMGQLVDVLNTRYPSARVLLDVQWLFWTDHNRDTLWFNYQQAAQSFWQMAQASGAIPPASQIYGIVVNDEAYNATNAELNLAVQHGVDQWSAWSTVDRWVAFDLTDHVPFNRAYDKTVNGGTRATNGFPWRYDVISIGDYAVYNPNNPGDPYNAAPLSGQLFDQRYATFLSRLRSHQRVHLNVRSWWFDAMADPNWTIGGTGWNRAFVKWTTRAWCRWAKGRPEIRSWTFWSYDQHSARVGDCCDSSCSVRCDPRIEDCSVKPACKGLIVQASTLYDPASPYYVPDLESFHDTVLLQGWGGTTTCP